LERACHPAYSPRPTTTPRPARPALNKARLKRDGTDANGGGGAVACRASKGGGGGAVGARIRRGLTDAKDAISIPRLSKKKKSALPTMNRSSSFHNAVQDAGPGLGPKQLSAFARLLPTWSAIGPKTDGHRAFGHEDGSPRRRGDHTKGGNESNEQIEKVCAGLHSASLCAMKTGQQKRTGSASDTGCRVKDPSIYTRSI